MLVEVDGSNAHIATLQKGSPISEVFPTNLEKAQAPDSAVESVAHGVLQSGGAMMYVKLFTIPSPPPAHCLQNPYAIEIESYALIAEGAQRILDRCSRQTNGRFMVAGQAWYSDNWNVIVRKDYSDGCSPES
jgi:hypothetical protein